MTEKERGEKISEPTEERTDKNYSSRLKIFVGSLAAIFFVACGAWLLSRLTAADDTPALTPPAVIGYVNLEKVTAAHPAYSLLNELLAKRAVLKAQTENLPEPMTQDAPEADKEPFDDSVWQKNAQNIIGERAEIERRRKKAAQEYREKTQEEFKARRDAIDGEYLNAILNIRLKLQNADSMRLSEDAIAELNLAMENLQIERGRRQFALDNEREEDIARHADAAVAAEIGDWRERLTTSKAQLESEAALKQSEAQKRNAEFMEQQMSESLKIQNAVKKKQELILLEGKIAKLRRLIESDIESRAAKTAIKRHFTMIAAQPALDIDYLMGDAYPAAMPPPEKYVSVIPVAAADVTEELIKEIETIEFDAEQFED